ncbi:MAG: N-acetylmuramoyl-L-alanine amidase [Candidatus Gastranaerophilales bacterium]|nr:N-acetylmuramoyl-L-alanine amidase [Candidatus Gastranaerophilales bacterium]
MKKFILTLVLLFITLANSVFSAELYKIKPVNFDISNSIIFVPIKTQPNNNITNNIKYYKLDDSNGVGLEISSAILNAKSQDLFFSDGDLKEFQIIQNTANSVKITMYFKDKFNTSNLKIGNINNNLLITIKPLQPYNMNYYINTYRESGANSKDYKEDILVTTRTIEKQTTPIVNYNNSNKSAMNEINQAFLNSNYQKGEIYGNYQITDISADNNLRSKYHLNTITTTDNIFVISGTGTVSVEKPFMLEKPLRMIFDIPNATINKNLHNKEFALANGDKIKSAQFNQNTTRLVVTSENAAQYIPVYSTDSQNLILTAPQNLMTNHLPSHKTNIVKTTYQKSGKDDNLIFEFDKPVVYSIKRTSENLYIYFLNAEKYNDTNFQSTTKTSPYNKTIMHLMKTGMRLTVPVAGKDNLNAYISPDGKVFKISSEKIKIIEEKPPETNLQKTKKKEGVITSTPVYNNKKNNHIIVIDAGHGGKDCGALRDGILEKDITLDVSDRLQSILQKKGYKVYMTRTNDTYITLEDRVIFTENINPAAFISVHVNSCNMESPKGIETHYYNDNSLELANCVHTKLTKKISNTSNRGLLKSRFYVIKNTTVPAILVEIGFISNTSERNELTTPQRKQATAEGIAEGIIEYLNSQK